MITGDYAVTAAAVAGQLGIEGTVLTGAEFGAMSDEEALAKAFALTTAVSFVLLVLSTVLGIFHHVMKTVTLDVQQWLVCTAVALSVVVAAEIRKAMLRRTAARPPSPRKGMTGRRSEAQGEGHFANVQVPEKVNPLLGRWIRNPRGTCPKAVSATRRN